MGLYVEVGHDKVSKLEWFEKNSISYENYNIESMYNSLPEGHRLVCLVDNGFFYAAAVAYCLSEAKTFADPNDYRPKQWFVVSDELLKKNCPSWDIYIED